MIEQLQLVTRFLASKATAEEITAATTHVVALWTLRAARRYSYDWIMKLAATTEKLMKDQTARVEELRAANASLEKRIRVLEQTVTGKVARMA